MATPISELVTEKSSRSSATELFNELLASPGRLIELLSEVMGGVFHSREFGLKGLPAVNVKELLASGSSTPNIPPEERLQALVGNEPGIVVSSTPMGSLDFPVVMGGMASNLQEDDLIEVLHMQHANLDRDGLTWFSLAVRAARFGSFTNVSKWWVFYKAYAVGPMVDREVILAERRIKETLEQFADRINLIRLKDVDTATLLDLFEPRAWRYVLDQARRVHDVNSVQKGVLPELLTTALVAQWNCLHIKTSFKPRILLDMDAEGEFEVLAIQPAADSVTCIVVEVKGQSTTGDDLTREIKRFASKLHSLGQVLPELAKELSYNGHLKDLRGIFISMARLKGFKHRESSVALWDFDRFRVELGRAKVPARLTRQLEPMTIAFRAPSTEPSWSAWIESGEDA